MSSSFVFAGRRFITPTFASKVLPTEDAPAAAGPVGRMVIIGEAAGGRPVSTSMAFSDMLSFKSAGAAKKVFRSGDLRDACAIAFDASDDPASSGPSEVIAMKVNQAIQASSILYSGGTSVGTMLAKEYGDATNQLSRQITQSSGKYAVDLSLGSTDEPFAAIGGDDKISVVYVPGSNADTKGWDTMRMQNTAAGVRLRGQKTIARTDSDLAGGAPLVFAAGDMAQIVTSSLVGPTSFTVYGLNGTTPVKETITVTGTGTFNGAPSVFTSVLGAAPNADITSGTATINRWTGSVATDNFAGTFTTGATQIRGGVKPYNMWVANTDIGVALSTTATTGVVLWGKSASGAAQAVRVVGTGAASDYIATGLDWSKIEFVSSSLQLTGVDVLVAGHAVVSSHAAQTTLGVLADYITARNEAAGGFTATVASGEESFLGADLDYTNGADLDVVTAADGLTGDLAEMISALNGVSQLTTIEEGTFVPQVWTITVTATTASAVINGVTVGATAGSTTLARDALLARLKANPTTAQYYTYAASGTLAITATGTTGGSMAIAPGVGTTVAAVSSIAFAHRAPDVDAAPVFFTGGSEGTATVTDYQTALDLCKKFDCEAIVVYSTSTAVISALKTHIAAMENDTVRMARRGFSGVAGAGGTGTLPTKTEAVTAIKTYFNHHMLKAFVQGTTRANADNIQTNFDSRMTAVLNAAQCCGLALGVPATYKAINVQSFRQDASWTPENDSDALITAGASIMWEYDNAIRWTRDVTTWLKSDSDFYCEDSVVRSVMCFFPHRVRFEMRQAFMGTAIIVSADGSDKDTLPKLKAQWARIADRQASAQSPVGRSISSWDPGATQYSLESTGALIETQVVPMTPFNFGGISIGLRLPIAIG